MNTQDMPTKVGESKARKRKTKRNSDSWYKRNAQDFFDGTRDLSAEARGIYGDLTDLIYIHGGALQMSDRVLAGKCVMDVRKFARIKQHLIDTGKLFLTPEGHLHNERAAEELAARKANAERRAKRASGQRSPHTNRSAGRGASSRHRLEIVSRSFRDRCENPNDISGHDEHMPTYQEKEERREDSKQEELPREEDHGSGGRVVPHGAADAPLPSRPSSGRDAA